ncbi:unnamed protein product [Blepharisma stoltei]|uniref:Uncharacterized protein n=1 Tax=Blepharisma stoltei TaxID=1481888 RepID=A0AAU9J512_9CILI|nr:unnamed protein product [Blepharisma stoltei]
MAMLHLTVFKLDHRVFWAIFWILHLFLIACMIGILCSQNWVKSESSLTPFEGSLSKVTNGYDKIDEDSYTSLSDSYCTKSHNSSDSFCKTFEDLSAAYTVYLVFEVIGMICILIWAIILGCFIFNINCFPCTFCCSTCALASHYIALFGWIVISKANFEGDCTDSMNEQPNSKRPHLCVSEGPKLSLFLAIFIPIVVISFVVIGATALYKKSNQGLEESEKPPAVDLSDISFKINNDPDQYDNAI